MRDILIGFAIVLGMGAWFMLVTAVTFRGDTDGPRCPGRWGQQGDLCPYCHSRQKKQRTPHG